MTFANSEYLVYTVLAAGLSLLVYLVYIYYRNRIVMRYFSKIVDGKAFTRRYFAAALFSFAILVLFSILVLRPQWGFTMKQKRAHGVDLVVALDVSRSMYTRDVQGSRLDRAKNAVRYLAERMPGRMGLILFAGDAFVQCPLTLDRSAYVMYLDYAGADAVAVQGTDIGRALYEADRLFKKQNPNRKVLLVITDGEDHEKNVKNAVDDLSKKEITVHTASVGYETGAPVPLDGDDSGLFLETSRGELVKSAADIKLLRMIADRTGGTCVDLNKGAGQLSRILKQVRDGESSDFGERYVREGRDRFQLFAILCILLLTADICLFVRWKR
ncbi:MAG: VWA domain-containing protein [Spirochaetota bacterium]